MRLSILFLIIFMVCYSVNLKSQCDSGSEPECQCETAEVLCSVSELDGFSSSMSSFQHPDDGPTPFCGSMTQTNNPTWFAFIAWCDNITMEIDFDNCTSVSGISGAQLAVYEDCSFNNQIACDDDCNADGSFSLDLDVVIGESYYVMLDGCLGSACDYELSVSPTDCDEFIEDWDEPVTEDEVICIGNTVIYDVDQLNGATSWHWFLDGDEIEVTDVPSYEINWNVEGVYELCVDASNICLDVDEEPAPNCVTITAADPNAGEIEVDDTPECPEEFMDIFVNEYNMEPQYVQALIFVNVEGEVVQVSPNTPDVGFIWPTCGMFTVYSLNFPEDEELELPDVGDDYFGSDCVLFCCDEVSTGLVFFDDEVPEFDRPPEDVTVDCYNLLEDMDLDDLEELEVVDNCTEDAFVLGTELITADTCNGGTIVREWSFADACNNEVTHTQTITILPLSAPAFDVMLNDTTMTNLEFQNYGFPTLQYDNSLPGECNISGSLMPSIEDNRNGCGGHVILSYSFTDFCGRTIETIQRIDIMTDVMASDTTLNICDENLDGLETITQEQVDMLIADDVSNITIVYYPTQDDLDNGTNSLAFPLLSSDLPESAVFAAVTDASGCDSEIRIDISVNTLPNLDFDFSSETCLDAGDGQLTIIDPSVISDFDLTLNGDTITENVTDSLMPGTYYLNLTDSLNCTVIDSFEVLPGIALTIENIIINCNNNGTGTLETDDFYEISFSVTGGTGQYLLNAGTSIVDEPYNYNDNVSIQVPADGNMLTISAEDSQFGCSTSLETAPLTQCSTQCVLTADELEYTCNDNGTPLDGADDFYEFTVLVSAINPGMSATYNIFVDGMNMFTFNYSEVSNFTLPASGAQVTLDIQDSDIAMCQLNIITEALSGCSNLCQLDIEVISVECIDPSTPADNADDLYTVEFSVTGINASSEFIVNNTGQSEAYGNNVSLSDNLIIDGPIIIIVEDSEDSGCTQTIEVQPPAPCSSPCDVLLSTLNILDCDDNMTGMNSADDQFQVEISITSILGTGLSYNLRDMQGNIYGPYEYGQLYTVGPFSADGNEIILSLTDSDNATCTLDIPFLQEPCSECNHMLELIGDVPRLDCENTVVNISSSADSAVDIYAWEGPDNFASSQSDISISDPGDYTLTVTFEDGCVLSETIEIDASLSMPISNAGEDELLNCVVSQVTLTSELSQYGDNIEINWLDEDNNIIAQTESIQVTTPGTYGLQLIDTVTQCVSQIDFVNVIEYLNEPLAVIYAEPTSILDCNIQSIELSHETEPNTVYTWAYNNQEFPQNILTIENPITVNLIALDTVSLCESDTTIDITDFEIYPMIDFTLIETLDCTDNQACVEATSNTSNPIEYSWLDAGSNLISNDFGTYCFDTPGEYYLELTDTENGCQSTQLFMIEAPDMPEVSLPATITIINDESYDLTAQSNIPESELQSVEWLAEGATLTCYNCLSTTITQVQDSTFLNVVITTQESCRDTAEVLVRVKRIPKIYMPNIFNPGRGDRFTVFASADYDNIEELSIFDRWGNPVFTNTNFAPNDPDLGWDGTRDGKRIEQGVYVYFVRYESVDRIETLYGTVTLLR